MKVTTTQTDLLPHIPTNNGLPSEINVSVAPTAVAAASEVSAMAAQSNASEAVSGSYKFFGFFEVDYSLSISPPEVKVDLYITALGGKVRIAGVDLNPNHPTAKIGGSALGFKAEATLTYDFSTSVLTIQATGCAPFVGCKTGSTQIHL